MSKDIQYALFKGQNPPPRDEITDLGLQAHWDDESGALNPSGLSLSFEKITGARDAAAPARYRLLAGGADGNKVFTLASWHVGKEIAFDSSDVYVNEQGLLLQHEPTPDQSLSLSASDELEVAPKVGMGEPVRYLFAQRDGELRIYGTLVPRPVVDEEQGCRVEARVAAPEAKAVLIVLDGFPAKDKVPVVLESGGASINELLDTDENGHAVVAVFPYVPGKVAGTLKASAEGPNCLPFVLLPWGSAVGASPAASAH